MGGWILIFNRQGELETQVNNFRRIFTVAGVPGLQYKIQSFEGPLDIICWRWSLEEGDTDLTVVSHPPSRQFILIDGVITDLGKWGPADIDRSLTALKVLNAWNACGQEMVEALNGSFAIVIYSYTKKQAVCIQDRIASRPTWFSRAGDTYCLGNFPAAVAAFHKNPIHLDGAGLWSLLTTSRPVRNRSIYYEVRSLNAGQIGRFQKEGAPLVDTWYELKYRPDHGLSVNEWGEVISGKLQAAGRRMLTFSTSPYLFLSGGMDSRVAAAALGEKIRTVTLTTQPNMNSRVAERVARALNIEHRTVVRAPYWYLDSCEAAALIAGGNYNIQHAHFMVPVIQIAAENPGASFLLGDLLENFNKHYFRTLRAVTGKLSPEDLPTAYNTLYPYTHKDVEGLQHILRPEIAEKCRNQWSEELIALGRLVMRVSPDRRDILDALFRWYHNPFCPTNLMHECIKPLAPLRNIMFDNGLLAAVLRVPARLKDGGVLHRKILWNLNRQLLFIANSNFWLPPVFPRWAEKLTRKVRPVVGSMRRKVLSMYRKGPVVRTEGSWHMLHVWYRQDAKYKKFLQETLLDHGFLPEEIFNLHEVRKGWQAFQNGDLSRFFEISMLLSFALLHKRIPVKDIKF